MIPQFLDKSKLPHKPGVYIFKDKHNRILYVGKAIDLYHRIASYFSKDLPLKTSTLVSQVAGVETVIVESELEALILEANLIKKNLPPFNVRLTDDKDYLYIAITREDFPRVITARKQDLKIVKKYFGPFPSGRTVKTTLKQLRKIFSWCTNPPGPKNRRLKPCFYYHINLCPGACVGKIDKRDYQKIISRFSKFMEGKKGDLLDELTKEMEDRSQDLNFEEAQKLKKIIEGVNYLTQPNRIIRYLENPNFLEDERRKALKELQNDLNLSKLPERIEGYDISNIQGKEATGSMVVLTGGEVDKSQYRRFKIHISGKPNDVGMHKEMMRRRLNNDWPLPDLIIIDGGRGQVNGIFSQLQAKGLNIPIYGLAKRMEWLYSPGGEVRKLSRRSLSLKLLQKLRDEAHRFAITYHRKLYQRALISGR